MLDEPADVDLQCIQERIYTDSDKHSAFNSTGESSEFPKS